MNVITCMECGKPWGAILDRKEEPSDVIKQLARSEMVAEVLEQFEADEEEGSSFDTTKFPQVELTRVVYITQAAADFASDQLQAECILDACWQEIGDCDLPKWFLKQRKQRNAYRWDCCEMGYSDNYLIKPATPELEVLVGGI